MIECNKHSQGFIEIEKIPQTGVHTATNLTFTDSCTDQGSEGHGPMIKIKAFMNNLSPPFSRITFDGVKCNKIKSNNAGCIQII